MAVGEWDQRQLCPDGGCVGVIGPDGTCKVCGRAAPNWGDERKRGLIDPPEGGDDEDDEDDDDSDDGDGDELAAGADGPEDGDDDGDDDDADDDADDDGDDDGDEVAAASSPSDWGARRLCPDGACIGLLGPDGTCRVCGRAAPGADPTAAPDPGEGIAAAPASTDSPDPASAPVTSEQVTT